MKTVSSLLFSAFFLLAVGHPEAAIAQNLLQINQRPIEKIRLDLWYFGVKVDGKKTQQTKPKKKQEKLPEELSVPLNRYFSTSL